MTHLDQFKSMIKAWGGRLVIFESRDEYDHYFRVNKDRDQLSDAPFTDYHGLDFERRLLLATKDRVDIVSLIHEAGHTFASRRGPWSCNEFNFLGWEIRVAQILGCMDEFNEGNDNYQLNYGITWGILSNDERNRIIENRIAFAYDRGLIDTQGEPVCIRQRGKAESGRARARILPHAPSSG